MRASFCSIASHSDANAGTTDAARILRGRGGVLRREGVSIDAVGLLWSRSAQPSSQPIQSIGGLSPFHDHERDGLTKNAVRVAPGIDDPGEAGLPRGRSLCLHLNVAADPAQPVHERRVGVRYRDAYGTNLLLGAVVVARNGAFAVDQGRQVGRFGGRQATNSISNTRPSVAGNERQGMTLVHAGRRVRHRAADGRLLAAAALTDTGRNVARGSAFPSASAAVVPLQEARDTRPVASTRRVDALTTTTSTQRKPAHLGHAPLEHELVAQQVRINGARSRKAG